MERVNNLIDESLMRVSDDIASFTDFELVYYDLYLNLDGDMKKNVGKSLLLCEMVDLTPEEDEKVTLLKSVISQNLGISRVLK